MFLPWLRLAKCTFYRILIYVHLLDDDPFMRQLQAVFAPLLGSRGRP